MASLFNQYSMFLILIALLALVGFLLFRKGIRIQEIIAFLVIFAALILVWMTLRPTQTPLSNAAEEVQARIGAGKPVLLEFQSPYCVGCTALKPVVDRLEEDTGNQLDIIRLNVQEPVGRELAGRYGFQYTPTFIFFDGSGSEMWREVGGLDVERVKEALP
jgi:thiol-disulfide isomerase/thioredoxin